MVPSHGDAMSSVGLDCAELGHFSRDLTRPSCDLSLFLQALLLLKYTARASVPPATSRSPDLSVPDRVAGALWGLFVGDALAMPVCLVGEH